ncbi:MAG: hypothetical protein AAGJ46_13505 [Planctomycetota bacterium]
MRPASPIALLTDNQSRPGKLATEPADPVSVPAGATTIGGGRLCSLRLRGGGVRPLHCVINTTEEGAVVRRWAADTLLNGKPFTEAPLKPGDRLSVASIEVKVVASTPLPDAPQPEEFETPIADLANGSQPIASNAAAVEEPTAPAPVQAEVSEFDTPTPVAPTSEPDKTKPPAQSPVAFDLEMPVAPLPAVPAHLFKPLNADPTPALGDAPIDVHDDLSRQTLGGVQEATDSGTAEDDDSSDSDTKPTGAPAAAAPPEANDPVSDPRRGPDVAQLRRRARRLLGAVRQERERAETLIAANAQLSETRGALADAAAAAEQVAEAAKEDLSDATQQLAELASQLAATEQRLAEAEGASSDAESSAQQALADREAEVAGYADRIGSLENQVADLQTEIEQLTGDLELAKNEVELTSASRAEAEARAAELEAERDSLAGELAEQSEQLAGQQRRVAEVEAALARLESATAVPAEAPIDESPVEHNVEAVLAAAPADDQGDRDVADGPEPTLAEPVDAWQAATEPEAATPSEAPALWEGLASSEGNAAPEATAVEPTAAPQPQPSVEPTASNLWDIESSEAADKATGVDATESSSNAAEDWLASFGAGGAAGSAASASFADLGTGTPEATTASEASPAIEDSHYPEEAAGPEPLSTNATDEAESFGPLPIEAAEDAPTSEAEAVSDSLPVEDTHPAAVEPQAESNEPTAPEVTAAAEPTPAETHDLGDAPPLGQTLLDMGSVREALEQTQTTAADEEGLVRAEQPAAAAPESFIDKYAGMLPEDSEPAPAPQPIPAPQPEPEPAAEDDSLDDYMAALMQRIRGEAATTPPEVGRVESPEPQPAAEPAKTGASAFPTSPAMEPTPVPKSELLSDLSEMRRATAPEQGADLSALRELANSSARSHIGVADKKENKDKANANLAISGVAMACAAFLGLTAPGVLSLQFVGGLAGFGWAGYWGMQTLRHMNAASKAGKGPSAPAEPDLPIDKPVA